MKTKYQKKKYKNGHMNACFGGVLSLLLVLETNLISHTLKISSTNLILIGLIAVCILIAFIAKKMRSIEKGRSNKTINIISENSIKNVKVVSKLYAIPLLPLFGAILCKIDRISLFYLLLSIILLMIIKIYFDNITYFSDEYYFSGFDKFKLNKSYEIKQIDRTSTLWSGNIVTIEIYFYEKYLGYDRIPECDYNHLINRIICERKTL